jgi:hypothetical protein
MTTWLLSELEMRRDHTNREVIIMKKLVNVGVLVLLSLTLASRSAYGIAMINLNDGVGDSVTIIDNGACLGSNPGACLGFSQSSPGVYDLAAGTAGQIVVSGSLGVWNINVSTGLTKPVTGNATNPKMDLNTTNVSTAAGTLTIKFTDDGFGPIPNGTTFADSIGGTTNGTVTATELYDANNGTKGFFSGTQIAILGPFSGPSFSGNTTSSGVAGTAPFSLTQVVTITHTTAGLTSLDYSKSVVPEPSAFLLMGSGLAGLGYLRLRRRQKKA